MVETNKAKRDFVFIDESGDPGSGTSYYIVGLIHLDDATLRRLNIHLGAFRYFGSVKKELKSTRLNKVQKDLLGSIFELFSESGYPIKASAVYVDKARYRGVYLKEKLSFPKSPTRFKHLILRKLLEFHFQKNKPQSNEIEIVVDRFHSNEAKEQQMRNYLRKGVNFKTPPFLHIIQADSRYVELLQMTDWIIGKVKEKYFTKSKKISNKTLSYISIEEVRR